jgi:hypothetical protein
MMWLHQVDLEPSLDLSTRIIGLQVELRACAVDALSSRIGLRGTPRASRFPSDRGVIRKDPGESEVEELRNTCEVLR